MTWDTPLPHDCIRLFETIKKYWPGCRITEDAFRPMYESRLRYYDVDALDHALWECRGTDLNGTAPDWDLVLGRLRGKSKGEGRNDLQALLDSVRKTMEKFGRTDVDRKSDFDVWLEWLNAQTYPVLYDTVTRKLYPDPDGRRAKAAMWIRERETYIYRTRLEADGIDPPDFLRGSLSPAEEQKQLATLGPKPDDIPF